MSQFSKLSFTAMIALLMTAPLWAADDAAKAAKKGKKDPLANHRAMNVLKLPEDLKLTDEQKTKLGEIKKDYDPKIREVLTKREAILTAEQKKARAETQKANKAEGKKGKDAQTALAAAIKLTDEQKKQTETLDADLKKLTGEARGKVTGLLTAEQKATLKEKRKAKKD